MCSCELLTVQLKSRLQIPLISVQHKGWNVTVADLEKKEGLSINLIFKNKGEEYFRKIECEQTLSELKKGNSVISLGGGAFLNNTIKKSVKKLSVSFWLDVSVDELIKRLKKNKRRPLLFRQNTSEIVKKIYFDRKKTYNEADFRIKCKSLKSEEIADKILDFYEKLGN